MKETRPEQTDVSGNAVLTAAHLAGGDTMMRFCGSSERIADRTRHLRQELQTPYRFEAL